MVSLRVFLKRELILHLNLELEYKFYIKIYLKVEAFVIQN